MTSRHTKSGEILSTAYAARIEAVEALRAAGLGAAEAAERLKTAAVNLRVSAAEYGDALSATNYRALADLVQMMELLLEWRAAVLDANADAQRFVTAAKERATIWNQTYGKKPFLDGLLAAAEAITKIDAVSEVAPIAVRLAAVPLPIGLYAVPSREYKPSDDDDDSKGKSPQLQIAFLKFTIDGTSVAETYHLSPGETHDLDVEVRVSRWPAGATALVLEPVSIEPAGTYQLPTFSIDAPMGDGPFRLTKQGRAMLAVPQHFGARPYEFKYVAHFLPANSEQPVETVGQRTLLLEGINPALHPLTGYGNLDRKLVVIRNHIRPVSGIGQQELADALTLAAPLVNLAGQARQDNYFKGVISESEFQRQVTQFLRARPDIGAALDEHPHAAGGITDLSFKGIRLELKVEAVQNMVIGDCARFLEQTASYVGANGKRLGILCVLDCSPKKQAAFPAEDGVGLQVYQQTSTPVFVITILVQGHLSAPSSFSH
jgi:hypothetical protein